MAKVKLNKIDESGRSPMKPKKHSTKQCSVRLKRMSDNTLKRLLNTRFITHNLTLSFHRNRIRVDSQTFSSKNDTFDIKLKVSESQILAVQDQMLQSPAAKPLKCNLAKKRGTTIAKKHEKHFLAEAAWQACKIEHTKNQFQINTSDIVCAKVKGHQPWPAVVLGFEKRGVKVEFFGADSNERFGYVTKKEITLFKNSAEVVSLILKRDIPKYKKAVKEAEHVCGLPAQHSLCNQ